MKQKTLYVPIYSNGRMVHMATVTQWDRGVSDGLGETFGRDCYVRSERTTCPLRFLYSCGAKTMKAMEKYAVKSYDGVIL